MPTEQEKRGPNKTAFILSQPGDMPAKQVVERAKKNGIDLSAKYVYVARSNAKRKAGRSKGGPKRGARSRQTSAPSSSTETAFRRLAVELGLGKAEALLQDTKRKIADAIAGR